ncbi:hypothetical protein H671_2g6926 [Cricetulus griseus]|nr:hypothetical protein H671_2g6926 [Cricetulus griseus]
MQLEALGNFWRIHLQELTGVSNSSLKSGVSDLALRCPLLLHLVQPRDKTPCHFSEEQEEKKSWRQIPAQPETEMLSSEGAGITKAHAA